MKLMLDTNLLARLCHPTDYRDVQEWFRSLLLRRPDAPLFLVSVLADYELRRKLIRLGATATLAQLDSFGQSLIYVPVTVQATHRAAELWAHLRSEDPTNERYRVSDADVLMAAQAALEGAVLVTSDVGLRSVPEITIKDWDEIEIT